MSKRDAMPGLARIAEPNRRLARDRRVRGGR
jgi:hypothetical protein